MGESLRPDLVAVLPDFNGGGAQRVALTLMKELARRGRRVEVLVLRNSGPLAAMLDSSIPLHDLQGVRLRSVMLPMLRRLRAIGPRIVFSTLGYVNLALLLMKPLLKPGTRLWIREANLPSISLQKGRYPMLTRRAYALLYPRASLIVCSSGRMRNEFLADFGVPDSLVGVLPNPVNEEMIRNCASIAVARDAGPGIRFVAAGRLTPQKGFDRLIEMFAGLQDANSRLSILGEGPMASELTALAERLGVARHIEFVGFRDSPWGHFTDADAFLLPSRWEGMPNAALEALALGLPVIATPESGGIAELAGSAPPGSVTVVDAGQPFIQAMRQVVPSRLRGLRPSLLPPAYRLESVVDTFERWLDQDACA